MDFAAVDSVRRELQDATRDGKPARTVVAERRYPTSADDVWDALTNPDRIPRWLMPISGDLRLGGHYQLEGNAGGTITTCEPPEHLAVTWEYDGAVSWVDVYLTPSDAETTLRLEHLALVEDFDDKWDEFGPGAVGLGWDLALLGLDEHVRDRRAAVEPGLHRSGTDSSSCVAAAMTGAGPRSPMARHARRPRQRPLARLAAYTGG